MTQNLTVSNANAAMPPNLVYEEYCTTFGTNAVGDLPVLAANPSPPEGQLSTTFGKFMVKPANITGASRLCHQNDINSKRIANSSAFVLREWTT